MLRMKMKYLLGFIMIIILTISNYYLISEYMSEYVPDNFNIHKLLNLKYRCIRYFNDKHFDKFSHNRCKQYLEDYIIFKLEKSRYIYMYYGHNIILISLFSLFILLV